MKAKTVYQMILESKKERTYFGCIMIDATMKDWMAKIKSIVKKDDLYIDPSDNSYGYNKNPHITILYGIHEDETDKDKIIEDIKTTLEPIETKIKEISIFENDEYDVVKFDIPVTKQLKKYRKHFLKYPNTQTFPDFHPHMTIAYVKKGLGKQYIDKLEIPFEITFDKGVYSYHPYSDKTKYKRKIIDLNESKES